MYIFHRSTATGTERGKIELVVADSVYSFVNLGDGERGR